MESREYYMNVIEQRPNYVDNLAREAEELNQRLAQISEHMTFAQLDIENAHAMLEEMDEEEALMRDEAARDAILEQQELEDFEGYEPEGCGASEVL